MRYAAVVVIVGLSLVLSPRNADADRAAQAEFEEAVADGSYPADPDFEWEPGDEGS